jgi:hypothetical protein
LNVPSNATTTGPKPYRLILIDIITMDPPSYGRDGVVDNGGERALLWHQQQQLMRSHDPNGFVARSGSSSNNNVDDGEEVTRGNRPIESDDGETDENGTEYPQTNRDDDGPMMMMMTSGESRGPSHNNQPFVSSSPSHHNGNSSDAGGGYFTQSTGDFSSAAGPETATSNGRDDYFDTTREYPPVAAAAARVTRYSSDETSSFSRSQPQDVDTRPNLKKDLSEDYSSHSGHEGNGMAHATVDPPEQYHQHLQQQEYEQHHPDQQQYGYSESRQHRHHQQQEQLMYGTEASYPDMDEPQEMQMDHRRNYNQSATYRHHHDQQQHQLQLQQHYEQQHQQEFHGEAPNYENQDYAQQEEQIYQQHLAASHEEEQLHHSFQQPYEAAAPSVHHSSQPQSKRHAPASAPFNDVRPHPRAGVPQEPSGGVRPLPPPKTRLGRRCLTERRPRRPDKAVGSLEFSGQDHHIVSVECAGCSTLLRVGKTAIMIECPKCQEVHPAVTCRVVEMKRHADMGVSAATASAARSSY